MGDMLSQAEIDALLGGGSQSAYETADAPTDIPDVSAYVSTPKSNDEALTNDQKDILGEIGNISMGTAATTLFALLNQKVWITTPKVKVVNWKTLSGGYDRPCVGIRVDYKEGLRGSNILILKERDVKIIASLMMGGVGDVDDEQPLSELDMSAIGEAMNQMVGSSSTSLSSMIKQKIDINTPQPFLLDFQNDDFFNTIGFSPDDIIACISFRMEIGTLIDSEIMQILPIDFAISMVERLRADMMGTPEPPKPAAAKPAAAPPRAPSPQPSASTAMPPQQTTQPQAAPMMNQQPTDAYGYPPQQPYQQPYPQQPYQQQPYPQQPYQQQPYPQQPYPQQPYPQPPYPQPYMQQSYGQMDMNMTSSVMQAEPNVNVKPAQFQSFDVGSVMQQKENMGIIMDVPLEVTVELGRTRKRIQDILEFSPGTIVELDKLAGEPIDILVNGKFVAKGEVVVIDENFGIRITDIISVDKRI